MPGSRRCFLAEYTYPATFDGRPVCPDDFARFVPVDWIRGGTGSPAATEDGVAGESIADFTADVEGEFEITVTVPDAPVGIYSVTATTQSGDESADDTFTIEGDVNASDS